MTKLNSFAMYLVPQSVFRWYLQWLSTFMKPDRTAKTCNPHI